MTAAASEEFKAKCVEAYIRLGSCAAAAREIGDVSPTSIAAWYRSRHGDLPMWTRPTGMASELSRIRLERLERMLGA